jgi:hypothetical protein
MHHRIVRGEGGRQRVRDLRWFHAAVLRGERQRNVQHRLRVLRTKRRPGNGRDLRTLRRRRADLLRRRDPMHHRLVRDRHLWERLLYLRRLGTKLLRHRRQWHV